MTGFLLAHVEDNASGLYDTMGGTRNGTASLIAAAPDLLDACRMAYLAAGASKEWNDAIMDSLRSAIIKAGG